MPQNAKKIYEDMKKSGLNAEQKRNIEFELGQIENETGFEPPSLRQKSMSDIYDTIDFDIFPNYDSPRPCFRAELKTLEELLERDKRREEDGFPRRIRIGKLIKPSKDKKGQVIVVPTTTEPKFYHDDSVTEENEDATGGSGEGEEGEVIGEQPAQPQQGEGEGEGAGEGSEGDHDVSQEAFDLGKALTEKFDLPNLKDKGKKQSFVKFTYDLTDRNRRFGQVLDKKATMRRVIKTNIALGRIKKDEPLAPEDLLINPNDQIFRIMSREKDYETQALVFFLRDYSGSMSGKPTEVVSQQHLFIYSWLMFQYQNNVETRFIVHDTEAKEVPDFYTYHQSQVAGGTKIAPAFALVNKIVEEESLAKDYNIYIFHGTDGDDWDANGTEMIAEVRKALYYANRIGITVAKNSWTSAGSLTTVEKYMNNSGLLKEKADLIKLDAMVAAQATESRIIESIKRLVEQT